LAHSNSTGAGTGRTLNVKIIAVSAKDERHRLQGLRNFAVSSKPLVLEEGIKKAGEEGIDLVD